MIDSLGWYFSKQTFNETTMRSMYVNMNSDMQHTDQDQSQSTLFRRNM